MSKIPVPCDPERVVSKSGFRLFKMQSLPDDRMEFGFRLTGENDETIGVFSFDLEAVDEGDPVAMLARGHEHMIAIARKWLRELEDARKEYASGVRQD